MPEASVSQTIDRDVQLAAKRLWILVAAQLRWAQAASPQVKSRKKFSP